MIFSRILPITIFLIAFAIHIEAAQEDQNGNTTSTTTTVNRLFSYAGPMLPSDWSIVSILNNRAIIGFTNNSARNALLDDLDQRDRTFLLKLQNGTLTTSTLSSAKEKIAQWSSSVSSTVSKFGKSVKEQLDSFINKKDTPTNGTTIILN